MTDEYKDIANDALREIEKMVIALKAANRHFKAEAEMNAALHLSEAVLPNPLATKVAIALAEGERAVERIKRALNGERKLPLGD